MEFIVNISDLKIIVKVKKKPKIKHSYIKILDHGNIEVTTNGLLNKQDIEKIVQIKATWIKKSIKKIKINKLNDDEFYYLGNKYKNLDNTNIDLFYKKEAKKIIPPLVDKYSKIMKLFPTSIKYRKNRRTWGSCNHKDVLSFNILLVKFPLEVIEYVVIHELAHIKHKNHSKKFWDLVFSYCSNYKQRENLLKDFL